MRVVPRLRTVAAVLTLLILAGSIAASPAAATRPTLQPLTKLDYASNRDPKCPDGYFCDPWKVVCNWNGTPRNTKLWIAENTDNPGYLGGDRETVPPIGVALFFSGGSGKTYWYPEQNTSNQVYVEKMMDKGIYVVDLRMNGPWKQAPSGDLSAGFDDLACRGASVVKHVYEKIYAEKLGLTPHGAGELVCGFCISGYSAGTNLAVYSLSHYGQTPVGDGTLTLESVIDGVIISSGPIYTALDRSCQNPVTPGYGLAQAHLRDVDLSYGYIGTDGPCYRTSNGPNWPPKWKGDSIAWSTTGMQGGYPGPSGEAASADYDHPTTRFHVLLGSADSPNVWTHSRVWQQMVEQKMGLAVCDFHQDQPNQQLAGDHCREQKISGMGHSIKESPAGMKALVEALIWPQPYV